MQQHTTGKAGSGDVDSNTQINHIKGTGAEHVDDEDQRRAHALLNKAVMRRLANNGMENTPADKTTSPPQANAADLTSSGGAVSLNGKSSSPFPPRMGSGPKTNSMQSLAVPPTGTVAMAMDSDDRTSVGSRRDSMKQSSMDSCSRKSVDYRLQTSQAVVTAGGGGEDKSKHVLMPDDSMMRAAIPALPLPLAVICLFLNILLPGSGTVVSGVAVVCCGKPRLSNKGDAVASTVCVNLCVGAAQLATVTFLLVGWFWSLAWGVKMVILAVEHGAEQRQLREKELQALALRAFGSPGHTARTTQPPV